MSRLQLELYCGTYKTCVNDVHLDMFELIEQLTLVTLVLLCRERSNCNVL